MQVVLYNGHKMVVVVVVVVVVVIAYISFTTMGERR